MTPGQPMQAVATPIMVIPEAGYYCRPTLSAAKVGKSIGEIEYSDGDKSLGFSSKILVMEADDLLRIRARVSLLYPDKRVIVAPCRSKLYLSRQPCVIDSVGTTSPDWMFFASGVIALIYAGSMADLSIALFDSSSTRLLWCLKWSDYVCFQAPTANFHVLNTQAGRPEHVGIWYENKNVAALMMSAISLLKTEKSSSQTCSKSCKGQTSVPSIATPRRKSLLRSLSLKSLRASKQQKHRGSCDKCDQDPRGPKRKHRLGNISRRRTVEARIRSSPHDCDKPISRATESSTVIETHDKYDMHCNGFSRSKDISLPNNLQGSYADSAEPEKSSPDVLCEQSSYETTVLRKLTRPGSFAVQVKKSTENAASTNFTDLCNDNGSLRSESSNVAARFRHLFQFSRRLSRSQSLKLPVSSCDSNVRSHDSNCQSNESNSSEQSRYQRSTKLQKPRAGTDTILLQALTVKCVIDTGFMARYVRERKQWGQSFKSGSVESTDLCVTDL